MRGAGGMAQSLSVATNGGDGSWCHLQCCQQQIAGLGKTFTNFYVERGNFMQAELRIRCNQAMKRGVEIQGVTMGESTQGSQAGVPDLDEDRIYTIHAGAGNQAKIAPRVDRSRFRARQFGELLSAACRYLFESNCAI